MNFVPDCEINKIVWSFCQIQSQRHKVQCFNDESKLFIWKYLYDKGSEKKRFQINIYTVRDEI